MVILSLVAFLQANAQHKKMDQVMQDVFEEMGGDNYIIRIIDGVTGEPVVGATLLIENIGAFESDAEGRLKFPKQPDGLLKGIFKKDGYIPALFLIDVAAQTVLRNRFYVSPVMNINQFRVVLEWDQQPADLDAHFVKEGGYHISYRNTQTLADGQGKLDRDDMDGVGPETITVEQLNSEAEYTYYVNNYSAEINASAPALSASKATVWIYGNNKLLDIISVPTNFSGKTWQVFKIRQGQVVK
jgi:hypothetical protein